MFANKTGLHDKKKWKQYSKFQCVSILSEILSTGYHLESSFFESLEREVERERGKNTHMASENIPKQVEVVRVLKQKKTRPTQ